jgi:hypothetical protein
MTEVVAGPVAMPPVRDPATGVRDPAIALQVPAARVVERAPVLPVPATAARVVDTEVRAQVAPTVGRPEVQVSAARTEVRAFQPRLRPAGMPIRAVLAIAPLSLRLTGERLQVASRRRSGPRRREAAVAGLRTEAGTVLRLDVTARLHQGETLLELDERPKRKTPPIPDLSRARLAGQPRPVATSGRGHPELRGPSRLQARGIGSLAGARRFGALQAPRAQMPVVGRPSQAATSGHCQPGEARADPASLSGGAGVLLNQLVGEVPRRSGVSSAATRSRADRR